MEKSSKRTSDKKRGDDKTRSILATREKKRVEDKKRASVASERRSTAANDRRKVVETKRPLMVEPVRRDNARQVVTAPLVRKTALTYAPKPPEQPAKRPVLVNDITVVSRVSDKPASPVILSTASPSRTSSAPANIPSIWPVYGSLRSGVGIRSNPFGGSGSEYHKGQDIAAPIGTPVIATADGTIVIAGWQRGYGWVVYIDHGNGISTRYGHLSRIDVEVGQTIRRGEQLGLVGSTGRSTGPHLHYEVRINGQPVSPLQYLPPLPALTSAKPASAPQSSLQR
ncbi:MAG: peptidoglycan DD-metalloendopeptidase family protein [Pyrinomonadaceae bacterium]|nr:peptidoglycan DD-metalloendopeptidase family protein [Pyrinomonadaceae bacterium]